ncbi:class I SAM-dependent methyltransferase [Ruegeria sp. 2012CJ41-6]|uniref:Class I SAM-dependent methyltransferase n=1 Tax=Ruegeria spongiae TaxID=2942209 RepID=A0ABT0Q7T0_9RHOB|nr:class I SAM-dependent methyltransferase [Ruegeria spongiae]MCL6285938.1 class I SAM-dependent methyltransferase [Ruegeria spongiae]
MTEADRVLKRRNELIGQYEMIHRNKPNYGRSSEDLLGPMMRVFSKFDGIQSILDYGCGRSHTVDWLAKLLDAEAHRYDPAIPQFSVLPVTECDAVICTDVLEHIPKEDMQNVISEIASVSHLVYFNICTRPAATMLPNGENAHCTVETDNWWFSFLQDTFPLIKKTFSPRKQNVSFITLGL